MSGARSMAHHALIVAGAMALTRILGLVREIIIAARFGTGETYDAYIAAFRLPDLLFVIVMSGAFGTAFIPVFGGFLARDRADAAWRLANTLLTWTVVILLAVAQLVLLFAEPLIAGLIAPELPPEGRELAVDLTRLLLLSPLLLGLGAAAKGMLEAHDSFTFPAVAPIVYNLGIILGAVALAPAIGIYGLAAGVIVGAAGHVGVQFAALIRRGFVFRFSLSRQTEGLREVVRLLGPRLLNQVVGQSNLIVMTNVASRLGEGSISALFYAQHLAMLPHGIVALSLSTVLFPRLARHAELGESDQFRDVLQRALRSLLFLVIPAVLVLALFRTSIVQVVLQYGAFSARSTGLVAGAMAFFTVGLLARALIEPVTRAFFALHDTRTPLVVTTVSALANVALSWPLAQAFGVAGLALSLSLTSTLRMVLLVAVLSRRVDGLLIGLGAPVTRMALAAVPLGLLAWALAGPLARLTDPATGRTVLDVGVFVVAVTASGAVYLLAAWLLRVPEVRALLARLRRRLAR